MNKTVNKMRAMVLEKFGGAQELVLRNIPIPNIESSEVLIKVEYAGVGQWDTFEREGGYAKMLGLVPKFPYVLGSEGAGTVLAIGENVSNVSIGDIVYAPGFLNPKGGFYAEYVAIDSKYVCSVPDTITIQEASTISGAGITALRGLEDVLQIKKGDSVLIFGASGGVGHMAVQLAISMGANVFAIASGEDGVEMIKNLGINHVINGRKDDIVQAAKTFAPNGFDSALIAASDEKSKIVVNSVRNGGVVAYPYGIFPEPQGEEDINIIGYHGGPDADIIKRLNRRISLGELQVHIQNSLLLEDACEAHLALNKHYLGKLCLQIHP